MQTFDFEGNEHGSSLDRVELEQLGQERTRLVVSAAFPSAEGREAMLEAGMERGVREGYEKLDELLVQLGQKP